MYRLICQKLAHFWSDQMALESTFFQMFIVLGMYNTFMGKCPFIPSKFLFISHRNLALVAIKIVILIVHFTYVFRKCTLRKTTFFALLLFFSYSNWHQWTTKVLLSSFILQFQRLLDKWNIFAFLHFVFQLGWLKF